MIPPEWSDELKERVGNEAASLMLHLGDHAPDLDDHVEPMLGANGHLYFRTEDNVFTVRGEMAFRWSWTVGGDFTVAGYVLGRRIATVDVPRDAAPPKKRAAARWN